MKGAGTQRKPPPCTFRDISFGGNFAMENAGTFYIDRLTENKYNDHNYSLQQKSSHHIDGLAEIKSI